MSTPTSGDLLLVNRGGVNYQINYDDMSTLQDTDLLLVNRAGVNYQIPASDLDLGPDGLILPSVDVLTPVNGAGLNEGASYTPLSSAYVSTDSTPIYSRSFPETITTVSGGSWVNENGLFDGTTEGASELTGAASDVSQAVFTPQAGWSEGETYIWAWASGGGTIEVLDNTDAVLRTYTLPASSGSNTGVGIIREVNKIRFTTTNQNTSLYLANINRATPDSIISGRVAFEFTDNTDLDKMVAPIIQVDENGNVKVPTTSTVDSTTTIPGKNADLSRSWSGSITNQTFDQNGSEADKPPIGTRMVWGKRSMGGSGYISDNVNLFGKYLLTTQTNAALADYGPELNETYSRYPAGNAYSNVQYNTNYIYEVGVAPKVLDIVTWSGNSSNMRKIPHNLGTKPGMIIIKGTDKTTNWSVWHKDITPDQFVRLNSPYTPNNSYNAFMSEPTQDAFYIGASGHVNETNYNYVAYVYAEDTPGKVKCGTYEGVGYTQAISTGLHAGFVLIKNVDISHNWLAVTAETSAEDKYWEPNNETPLYGSNTNRVALHDGNFTMEGSTGSFNQSGHTYIYLAIARDLTGPNSTQLNLQSGQDLEYFTTGTEITSNLAASGSNQSFETESYGGNGSTLNITPGSSTNEWWDSSISTGNKWMIWIKGRTISYNHFIVDSERSPNMYLSSNHSNIETLDNYAYLGDYQGRGYTLGNAGIVNNLSDSYLAWQFKASPQFFDVQKYVGTGSSNNIIYHDLGEMPGCIIFKNLKQNSDWYVYHKELQQGTALRLNSSSAATSIFGGWIVTTADKFTINYTGNEVNSSDDAFISYIFAHDTPYVKCGKYTGAGVGTQVNVGFKPRWMMIKNITGSGEWVILDKKLSNQVIYANISNQAQSFNFSFNSTGVQLNGSFSSMVGNGQEIVYVAIADESEGHPPFAPSSTTVTETPDPATATMVVNAESFDVGATASAPALEASITTMAGVEGNSLLVDSSTGTWMPGLYAKGSETTVSAPSAADITFTSTNAGTTPFSGVDATLTSRTWTLESSTTATGPWTVVDTYVDYDALASQDGATPWSSNKPALAADTFYRVKVSYDSTNAESVESVYSTFKTSA